MGRLLNVDQLRALVTVVDQGSFSAAARALRRAQSAVSYAIQELESDMGLPLFDRSGYRPKLTAAGLALLPRARRVLQEAGALIVQAEGLRSGLESDLTIVIDSQFPMAALSPVFHDFESEYPSVTTHVQIESVRAAVDLLVTSRADIGLVIALFVDPVLYAQRHVRYLDLVAVCAPGHDLARLQEEVGRPLTTAEVVDELQLVLSDRSGDGGGEFFGVSSVRMWRLADLGAKHALLKAGLGWGSLPRHIARNDLESGRLVELALDNWAGASAVPRLEHVLVHRRDKHLGPAGRWLFERLGQSLAAEHADRRHESGSPDRS